MVKQLLALVLVVSCSSKSEPRENPMIVEAKRCAAKGAELMCPRPIVRVENLCASQAYYRDKLGFKLDWEHGSPADFASVSRGEYQLFLCERCQGRGGSWSLTIAKDVDRLYTELKRRGAKIEMPPTDMEWHLREMHVADLDANVIRFGSPLDHD
jgi:catechol 2,3-dioxygenase-like lactoylglutathione lyase family enzyme